MALQSGLPEGEDVNLTPMIDVVFNLLIFFLLSSTYLSAEQESELELQLPQVSEAAPLLAAPAELALQVRADGVVQVDQQLFANLAELRAFLESVRQDYPDQAVVIRGDGRVNYEKVAQVLAICKQVGIVQVDLPVTEAEARE